MEKEYGANVAFEHIFSLQASPAWLSRNLNLSVVPPGPQDGFPASIHGPLLYFTYACLFQNTKSGQSLSMGSVLALTYTSHILHLG